MGHIGDGGPSDEDVLHPHKRGRGHRGLTPQGQNWSGLQGLGFRVQGLRISCFGFTLLVLCAPVVCLAQQWYILLRKRAVVPLRKRVAPFSLSLAVLCTLKRRLSILCQPPAESHCPSYAFPPDPCGECRLPRPRLRRTTSSYCSRARVLSAVRPLLSEGSAPSS